MTGPLSLPAIAPWPLAAQLSNALSSIPWALLAVDRERADAVVTDLKEQLTSLLEDLPVELIQVSSPGELLDLVLRHPDSVLVVLGLEALDADAWRRVDANRSRLARELPAILVLDESRLPLVVENAPNLWSWLGGSVFCGILEGDQAHAVNR